MRQPWTDFVEFHQNGWHGKIRRGISCSLQDCLEGGTEIRKRQNCRIRLITLASGERLYAKWLSEGQGGPWHRRLLHCLRQWFSGAWAFRIGKIHNDLHQAGIVCAEVVLMATHGCEQLFVTRELPFPTIAGMLKEANSVQEFRSILQKALEGIARMHSKGFVHGDCNGGNILLTPEGTTAFLDNDRTTSHGGFLLARGRRRNLIQFCAHLALPVEREQDDLLFCIQQYIRLAEGLFPEKEMPLLQAIQTRRRIVEKELRQRKKP